MKTIYITWKNSQKALRASSTFLKVGTFVGLNLAGMGINAVHAAPHTHGEGKLQILQAGSEWQFVLQLPAADVLGFEYAPSTTSEKKRYKETQKVFQRFDDIFTLSNTCELLDTTLVGQTPSKSKVRLRRRVPQAGHRGDAGPRVSVKKCTNDLDE